MSDSNLLGEQQQFIQRVVETRKVWILLRGDDTVVLPGSDGYPRGVMLFWSDSDLAEQYATGDWAEYQPHAIELNRFIHMHLPGLDNSIFWGGCLLGINWSDSSDCVTMTASAVKQELKRLLENTNEF